MIEEILPDLYRLEIPLPRSPLKALNSYLVKGDGRFLLIDTGMNREECRRAMHSGLERLGVDLNKTDIFITHLHVDHLGLAASLATKATKIYFNQPEASLISSAELEKHWRELCVVYLKHGFPEDELRKAIGNHPGYLYGPEGSVKYSIMKEGDTLAIGDYCFLCLETPGHSPGHMCLYQANKGILIAGDHILSNITPNIVFWPKAGNSLERYLDSLDKIYKLDVRIVLPGHRDIMSNPRKRIRELREHHCDRENEVLSALGDGAKNAFQLASCITWDINFGSWEQFPPTQKWFAFGEALAHIKYLEGEGMVREETKKGEAVFSLS
ncbi:MBL fold metallo-hydrolase [Chloroflexota bacterium]